jgi:cephalosporin-C deacetylase
VTAKYADPSIAPVLDFPAVKQSNNSNDQKEKTMLVDKPVAELYKYQGRNPRPADFDAYWKRAIKELDAVPAKPELILAEFQCPGVECFDLYFMGVRGAKIHARYIRPKKIEGPVPAVLKFHGYSGAAADWTRLLHFAAAGMVVTEMDCRGQGGRSEDTGGVKGTTLRGHIIRGLDDEPDNLLFRHIYLDMVQLARVVGGFKEVDENRMGCSGG